MRFDISLFYFFNNFAGQSAWGDALIVFFASYFAYVLILVFLAWVAFSAYSRREKIEIFAVAALSSLIARFGVVEFIRLFIHRPRPFSALPVHQLLTDPAWSFPSGHAAFFFALSTAVYLYNKKWGIGFFIATILMTLARVAAGVHYPSDVFAGAFIGIGIAYATFRIRPIDKIMSIC